MSISQKAKSLSSEFHINNCRNVWKNAEQLYQSLTNATPSSEAENINHIDFHLEEKKVDVKGLKKSHKEGFVLIEFLNVQGRAGWASKESACTHLAFQFPDHFIIVSKDDLRQRAIDLCGRYNGADRSVRARDVGYEAIKNKYIGRVNRKDVFVYIEAKELHALPNEILKYHSTTNKTP